MVWRSATHSQTLPWQKKALLQKGWQVENTVNWSGKDLVQNQDNYFCPWDKFLTTCPTNKVYTCMYFETMFNKRDYLAVWSYETHYAVSNSNFFLAPYQYYILLYPCLRFSGTYLSELHTLLLPQSSPSPIPFGVFPSISSSCIQNKLQTFDAKCIKMFLIYLRLAL